MPGVQNPHCKAWWRLKASCKADKTPPLLLQTFDGLQRQAIGLHRQHQTAALGHSLYPHCAGATDAVLAAHVRACQAQLMAQHIHQQRAGVSRGAARQTVDVQSDAVHLAGAKNFGVCAGTTHASSPFIARCASAWSKALRPSWRTKCLRCAALKCKSSRA